MPARSRPVWSLIKHLPLWVVPVSFTARFHGKLVRQLQIPEDLSVKMDVVDDLAVVWLRTAFEQQARQRLTLGMRWTILFSLPDHATEWCVPATARHKVAAGIGGMVEQPERDGNSVFIGLGEREPGEAQVQKRLPSFRPNVFEDISRATDVGAICGGSGTRISR